MRINKWLFLIPCIVFVILLFYIDDLLLPILMPGYRGEYAKECLFTFSLCFMLNAAFYIVLTASIILSIKDYLNMEELYSSRKSPENILRGIFMLMLLILTSIHVGYLMGYSLDRILVDTFMLGVVLIVLYILMSFAQMETVSDEGS